MKRKPKVKVENHERYIITYADLLTLLLAFFVILYAMSTPDPDKMEQLGDYFEDMFQPRTEMISLTENPRHNEPRTKGEKLNDSQEKMMKQVSEQNRLRDLKRDVDEKIIELDLEEEVSTDLSVEGLSIVLTSELLFSSGSYKLTGSKSERILNSIGLLVKNIPNDIKISGHTDNVPARSSAKSNWELSTLRAISVLEILFETNKIKPERLSATGYGEYLPIDTNKTVEGRQKNRRVEIIVLRGTQEGILKPTERGN